MASQWLGALPPPPGVEPNFIDPPSQRDRNIALHTILLSLVTILLVIRLYTRVWITKMPLGIEDYLCVASYWMSVAFSALVIKAYTKGIGRHIWDTPAPWLPEALMYFTIATYVYLILVMTIKLSFLFFYHRIFSMNSKSKLFIIGAMIFVGLLNTSLFVATILSCIPIEREWNPTVPGHCFNPVILPYFSGISAFLTDLYVLILPIFLLWQLNMRLQQKLKVSAVFGLGIVACVASLVRLIQTPELRTSYDATWTISNIIVWAALEANIGIICSCLIILPAFLDHCLPWSTRFFSRLFSSTPSGKRLNNPDRLSQPSADSFPKQNYLVEDQRLLQKSIIQTNIFSLGEIHDIRSPRPGNILPWASHTN